MRTAMACLLIACIALLCVYAGRHHPGVTLEACLAAPDRYDGVLVYSPHESVIGAVRDGGFTLRWEGCEIAVRGDAPHLKIGEYVGVKGIFHREGYIEALFIHVGRYRRMKMLASVAGAAIVFFLLWRAFRWNAREGGLEQRQHPS